MKKVLLVAILFGIVFLSSCKTKPSPLEEILNEVHFGFSEGDDFNHVTNNFTITRQSKRYEDALLFWDLSTVEYAKIENEIVNITRPYDEDVLLIMSLTISYNGEKLSKDFEFNLKYVQGEIGNPDNPIDPSITYYQITYKDIDKTLKKVRYPKGTTVKLTEKPLKEGHSFYGWLYNEKIITEIVLNKNITLTAVFNNDIFNSLDKDEEAVLNDLNEFYFLHYFFTKEKMDWPDKGIRGTEVSYQVLDSKDLIYFDFINNEVNPPKNIHLKTLVKLTIKKGAIEKSKDVEVFLGEPPLIKISEIEDNMDQVFIKIRGVITGYYFENKVEHYFIEDEKDGTMIVTQQNFALPLNLTGEFILTINQFGLEIMTFNPNVEKITIEKTFVYNEETFNNNFNKQVYLEGIVTKGLENKTFEILVNNKYKVFIKSEKTTNIEAYSYIGFTGYITKIAEEVTIIITDPKEIEVSSYSNGEITDLIMNSINLSSSIIVLKTALALPQTDPIFNSLITYEVVDDEAIIEDGVLLVPSDKTEIKLVAKIQLNNNKILTREYKVIIAK